MDVRAKRRIGWTVALLVAACSAGYAYYLSLIVPDLDPKATWTSLRLPRQTSLQVVGVLLTVLALVAPTAMGAWESRQSRLISEDLESAKAAAVLERHTRIIGSLTPIAHALSRLASMSSATTNNQARFELRGVVKSIVLNGLVDIYGGSLNARAIFYKFVSSPAGDRLVPENSHAGRGPVPDKVFDSSTPEGREALAAVKANQVRQWVLGMPGSPPPGWNTSKAYSGWVSVPVLAQRPDGTHRVHGMLTLDVSDPNTFVLGADDQQARLDWETVEAFGRLLAAALSKNLNASS